MKGNGGLYRQKQSPFWWMYYNLRGYAVPGIHEGAVVDGPGAEVSEREALKVLKRRIKQVHADQIGAKTFVTPKNERLLMDELLDALVADLEIREKWNPSVRSQMKPLRTAFGDRTAFGITDLDIQNFIKTERKAGKQNATINRSTQLLRRAFALNRTLGPGPVIPHLSEKDNVRRGFLDPADFERLVIHLPEDLQDFARWGYLTGWRKGTISQLDWASVDLHTMTMDVPGSMTKNGRAMKMTLDGPRGDIIRRRLAARPYKRRDGTMVISSLVFYRDRGKGVETGEPVQGFDKIWIKACETAGLGKILFHDLRRSAARNLRRAGNDENASMKITGHRTNSMFQRYNIIDDYDIEVAMTRLDAYLEKKKAEPSKVIAFEPKKKPASQYDTKYDSFPAKQGKLM